MRKDKLDMSEVEALLGKFKKATDAIEDNDIDYLVFGGIAVWAYGRRRQTRDIDILVKQDDAKKTLGVLGRAGFSTEETDQAWIYKASADRAHIDIIFRAKGEITLTPELMRRKRRAKIGDFTFSIMDPENLVLVKILATKEIRPADWYDALSILKNLRGRFDWNYFVEHSSEHPAKVLGFLFLMESFDRETGDRLVPPMIINALIDVYRRGQSRSKSA